MSSVNSLDDLTYGDFETLDVADLTDDTGAPAVFNVGDVLRWTAKYRITDPDANAIFKKSSADDVAFVPGGNTATIVIYPADYPPMRVGVINYVWDLQLAIGGATTNVRTLASGIGRIVADVTRTTP